MEESNLKPIFGGKATLLAAISPPVDPTNHQVKRKKKTTKTVVLWLLATFFIISGCVFCIHSPYEWILNDLLEIRSFSPMYHFWTNPIHFITCSANIFEVENPEEFMASKDPNVKLKLRDIGPVTYREHVKHKDIVRHSNGTLSYTTVRHVEFLEDHNVPGILNRTITVANFGLLTALSYLHSIPRFSKMGFNVLLRSIGEPLFMNITVKNYLWNNTQSNMVNLAGKFLPNLVPDHNVGAMHMVYKEPEDRVNVLVGKSNGYRNFFRIQQYNYQNTIPGFDEDRDDCVPQLNDATEGLFYGPRMENVRVLNAFRKNICQIVSLTYNKSSELLRLPVNEFVLQPEFFNRRSDPSKDCYKSPHGESVLPDGLTDVSRCSYGSPTALSLPHFLGFEKSYWNDRLEGMNPDFDKHHSRVFVEPVLGVGVRQFARTQINLKVPDLEGFPEEFHRFSGMVIPLMWGEIMLHEPPPLILFLLRFFVNFLPYIDVLLPFWLLATGIFLAVKACRR